MSDQPHYGDTKQCLKCHDLAMLFSEQALKLIVVTIYPEGSRKGEAYGPAWVCSNCGCYEPCSN